MFLPLPLNVSSLLSSLPLSSRILLKILLLKILLLKKTSLTRLSPSFLPPLLDEISLQPSLPIRTFYLLFRSQISLPRSRLALNGSPIATPRFCLRTCPLHPYLLIPKSLIQLGPSRRHFQKTFVSSVPKVPIFSPICLPFPQSLPTSNWCISLPKRIWAPMDCRDALVLLKTLLS